jgi:hypothetical protein
VTGLDTLLCPSRSRWGAWGMCLQAESEAAGAAAGAGAAAAAAASEESTATPSPPVLVVTPGSQPEDAAKHAALAGSIPLFTAQSVRATLSDGRRVVGVLMCMDGARNAVFEGAEMFGACVSLNCCSTGTCVRLFCAVAIVRRR